MTKERPQSEASSPKVNLERPIRPRSIIKRDDFEKVFRMGETPEKSRFRSAINYARDLRTPDLQAYNNLQELFGFVLEGYLPYKFQNYESAQRHKSYDYQAIFDILAAARYANRKLSAASGKEIDQVLREYHYRRGIAIGRMQTKKGGNKFLTAQHEIARIIEQDIIGGKLALASNP